MTRALFRAPHHAHKKEKSMPEKDDESQGPRLITKVTFGLGTAILAGVVVVGVSPGASPGPAGPERLMTTSTLGAVINSAGGGTIAAGLTTCCGGYN
jgi:hypothetical protein